MSFQAYKSKWTHNAFRLVYGSREVIADISEIYPLSESNHYVKEAYDQPYRNLPTGSQFQRYAEEDEYDSSQVQD